MGNVASTALQVCLAGGPNGGILTCPIGLAILALTPVGAMVGAIGGTVMAEAAETVGTTEARLQNAMAALKVPEAMGDQVFQTAQNLTRYPFTLLVGQGPARQDEQSVYHPLADQGVGMVAEVSVLTLEFAGRKTVDPSLALVITMRNRLIRTSDGSVVYTSTIGCRSRARTLAVWAADNTQLFHEELDRCYKNLAEKIVTELFLVYLPQESYTPGFTGFIRLGGINY